MRNRLLVDEHVNVHEHEHVNVHVIARSPRFAGRSDQSYGQGRKGPPLRSQIATGWLQSGSRQKQPGSVAQVSGSVYVAQAKPPSPLVVIVPPPPPSPPAPALP